MAKDKKYSKAEAVRFVAKELEKVLKEKGSIKLDFLVSKSNLNDQQELKDKINKLAVRYIIDEIDIESAVKSLSNDISTQNKLKDIVKRIGVRFLVNLKRDELRSWRFALKCKLKNKKENKQGGLDKIDLINEIKAYLEDVDLSLSEEELAVMQLSLKDLRTQNSENFIDYVWYRLCKIFEYGYDKNEYSKFASELELFSKQLEGGQREIYNSAVDKIKKIADAILNKKESEPEASAEVVNLSKYREAAGRKK